MLRSQNTVARGLGLAEPATLPLTLDADREGSLQLQGLVLDDQELPVEDAIVTLDSSPARSVRTEKGGTFVFTGLFPRVYQLEARHGSLQGGPFSVWLGEKDEPLVLHLRKATSLEVSVVEARSRQALVGASVEVRAHPPRSSVTDPAGRALLQALPTGRHVLRVSAQGFAPTWQLINVGEASPVPQRLTVFLGTGAAVSGVVVNTQGTPVAGVTVTPVPSTNTAQPLTDGRWDGVVTDTAGRWRFEHLEAGLYRFEASSAQRAPGTSAPVTLDGSQETQGVTITLPDSARLTGQVLDAQGQAVPYAIVRVALDEGVSRAMARQATSDTRGEFVLEGLPQSRLAVLALHETASSATRYVDLGQASHQREPLVLVLDAMEVIRGRVESSQGQPVGEAVVLAELPAARMRNRVEQTLRGQLSTSANASGQFELRGLVPGTYLLRAAPPGTSPQRRMAWLVPPVQAETRGQEVVLRLHGGGSIVGQVRLEDNTVPESFSVMLRGAGAMPYGGGNGQFALPGVPEGQHTLYVTGPRFITKAVPVQVQEAQQTELGVVVVQRGRQLQGRVLTAQGTPMAGATVSISQPLKGRGVVVGATAELEYGLRQTKTDAEGHFAFEGLHISALQLSAEHPLEGRSEPFQIEPGVTDLQVELRLAAIGDLEGSVHAGEQPVSGVLVLVTNPSSPAGGTSGTTGTDGRFRFTNLAPGTYTVLAMTDAGGGQQVQRTTVSVQSRQTARVRLEFPRGEVLVFVRAQPAEGARAASARVLLMGKPQPGATTQPTQVQMLTPPEPARFGGVLPGEYLLCVSPVEVNLSRDGGTPQAARCSSLTVTQQPAQQEVLTTMPPL
ncbi:MAG TPA: carboxypeptidase-like regulatory domain-containing protein [Myxococcaceae bacterium]